MTEAKSVEVNGQTIYIEMEAGDTQYGSEETSPGRAIENVKGSFDRARETVIAVSTSMVEAIQAVDKAIAPDQFELSFGIKFKIDGTVAVASVGSEAALTVKMTYNHKKKSDDETA